MTNTFVEENSNAMPGHTREIEHSRPRLAIPQTQPRICTMLKAKVI